MPLGVQWCSTKRRSIAILYFRIPHNTLCLPTKFCINHCFQMLLGICSVPQEHLMTIVYEKFGGQTKCIMGNSKIENSPTWEIFCFVPSPRHGFQSSRWLTASNLLFNLWLVLRFGKTHTPMQRFLDRYRLAPFFTQDPTRLPYKREQNKVLCEKVLQFASRVCYIEE